MANITRRGAILLAAMSTKLPAKDDAEWARNFRSFIKQLNRFIESMNDGITDVKQWKRVQQAWKEMES